MKTGFGIVISMFAPVIAFPVTCLSAPPKTGADLFTQHCRDCHTDGPESLQSSPRKMVSILNGGNTPAHHFKLDKNEMNLLLEYLKLPMAD